MTMSVFSITTCPEVCLFLNLSHSSAVNFGESLYCIVHHLTQSDLRRKKTKTKTKQKKVSYSSLMT